MMSLEAVKRVVEAEQQAQKQRQEGEKRANALVEEAKKKGASLIEVARWEAEMKVKKTMTDEEQNDVKRDKVHRQSVSEAQEQIRAEGRQRLDQAAEWIVGRVVEF